MTTLSATTKGKTTPAAEMDEIAQLRAQLAAAHAESAALKAKLESKGKGAGRAPQEFPADHLAPEGSSLRYLQDKPRGEVFDAAAKMLRAVGVVEAFATIHAVAESLAKAQGKTVPEVIDAAMVKTPRKPKEGDAPKVTGDATDKPE